MIIKFFKQYKNDNNKRKNIIVWLNKIYLIKKYEKNKQNKVFLKL